MKKVRIGILGSTRGTHLVNMIDAINQHKISATIEAVISNKEDALILERAKLHHIPTYYVANHHLSRADYDQQISAILNQHQIDLVLLVGYMRILSKEFVTAWKNKIINVHPSLLPAFSGGMNLDVHRAVLSSGVKETGCTVHEVTEEVDAGPILVQKKCAVLAEDTPETLKTRVQQLERDALIEAIQMRTN